jgi:hypothetical protein
MILLHWTWMYCNVLYYCEKLKAHYYEKKGSNSQLFETQKFLSFFESPPPPPLQSYNFWSSLSVTIKYTALHCRIQYIASRAYSYLRIFSSLPCYGRVGKVHIIYYRGCVKRRNARKKLLEVLPFGLIPTFPMTISLLTLLKKILLYGVMFHTTVLSLHRLAEHFLCILRSILQTLMQNIPCFVHFLHTVLLAGCYICSFHYLSDANSKKKCLNFCLEIA